jgi:hypothetical protein
MRSKQRPRQTSPVTGRDDLPGIDLGASARQIGLMETSSGAQYGLGAIAVALLAAVLIRPISRALRAWFRQ